MPTNDLISEIISNRLYLTNLRGASIFHENVDIIVTIMESPKNFTNVFYYAEDEDNFNIDQYFQQFYELMISNPDKKILVHCYSGVSRSATLVMSYLMRHNFEEVLKKKNKKLHLKHVIKNNILNKMKKIRPIVDPNDGFMEKLRIYHNYLIEKYKYILND